jgi:hypothetical protein
MEKSTVIQEKEAGKLRVHLVGFSGGVEKIYFF